MLAARADNRENDPEDQDSGDESDDPASYERHWNNLSVGEHLRLRHLIADRTALNKIQRLVEKIGEASIMGMSGEINHWTCTLGQQTMITSHAVLI